MAVSGVSPVQCAGKPIFSMACKWGLVGPLAGPGLCAFFPVWTLLLFCSHTGIFMLIELALLSFSLLLQNTWTQSAAR